MLTARKDYEDRRRRQFEGTARAKVRGLYKGRPENKKRNAAIATMLRHGRSWREVMDATGCSRTLLARIARTLKSEEQDALPAPPGDHVPAGQALSAIWQPLPLTQAEHEVIEGARDRPPADPMRFDE